jgi:hypothetical protein
VLNHHAVLVREATHTKEDLDKSSCQVGRFLVVLAQHSSKCPQQGGVLENVYKSLCITSQCKEHQRPLLSHRGLFLVKQLQVALNVVRSGTPLEIGHL